MSDQYEQLLRATILDDELFVEAAFQGAQRGESPGWRRVEIRPVLIRDTRHLQFTYLDGVQDTTKNLRGPEALAKLNELLREQFKSIQATTTAELIRVQISKKGRPIIHRERRATEAIPLSLAHDRSKPTILPEDIPVPFLSALGITTADGHVRADQRRKFRQINEFLRLIEETGEIEQLTSRPIHVVDLGCGSAALTFATYHYLTNVKGVTASMTGVDTKAHLMERHQATATRLGWDNMSFMAARIIDYAARAPADIVLALHACDTATDEALARAVRWRSKLIFSAPCCHHHLQAQLSATPTPEPFRPVIRHGIMRERLGDVLTDSFRALILRLMGYRAEVLEFVPVEHTPKNLMIRAVDTRAPVPASLVAEYQALKAYWGVTPYLEELLRDELAAILHQPLASRDKAGQQG